MKTLLVYVWKHRWCRLLIVTAILLGLPMLLPFARQTVFGPKIDDIPWCVWEEQARIAADPARYRDSWVIKFRYILQRDSGVLFRENVFQDDKLVPIHIELAHDHDVMVRRFALSHLHKAVKSRKQAVSPDPLPALRLHLDDQDAECRFLAANSIWRMSKDPAAKAAILSLIDCGDNLVRENVAELLYRMAATEPNLFEPLSKLAADPSPRVRTWAIQAMPSFGKRGLPTIRQALDNPFDEYPAVLAAGNVGADAAELIPRLLALQAQGSMLMRQPIAQALSKIDPERFPAPVKEKKGKTP